MIRREFITLLGGAAALPVAARAQQSAMPVIGFLNGQSAEAFAPVVASFRRGLNEAGYVEGQNVAIELASGEGRPERTPALIIELVRRQVAVIVSETVSAMAVKAATTTIPIVFTTGSDPVQTGLVASMNRPGGNVTGVVFFNSVLGPKRLELLRQVVPKTAAIAMLVNPNLPNTEMERRDVQAAARTMGQQLIVVDVNSVSDIEAAFATFVQRGAGALFAGSGAVLNSNRKRLVALAARVDRMREEGEAAQDQAENERRGPGFLVEPVPEQPQAESRGWHPVTLSNLRRAVKELDDGRCGYPVGADIGAC